MVIENFNIYGSNITEVRRLADLGTPVNGVIDVSNKSFLLLEPITCPHILEGDRVRIQDPSLGFNVLTLTGSIGIRSLNSAGIEIRESVLEGNGSNTLFDITSTSTGNELVSVVGSRLGSLTAGKGFSSLGTVTNVALVLFQSTIIGFSTGLSHIGGSSSFVFAITCVALDSTSFMTYSGTFLRAVAMQVIDTTFVSGGFVLKIDNAINFRGARIGDISESGATSFFDPTGLDQTDPRVLVVSTDGTNSFYIGLMSYASNATATTISTEDTFTDIVGTTVAGSFNERFTHSTSPNELTYNGVETIKITMNYSISATKTGGTTTYGIAMFIDTGSGFVMIPNSEIQTDFTNRVNSASGSIAASISTNDVIKLMIQNTENTANITVSSLIVNINA